MNDYFTIQNQHMHTVNNFPIALTCCKASSPTTSERRTRPIANASSGTRLVRLGFGEGWRTGGGDAEALDREIDKSGYGKGNG